MAGPKFIPLEELLRFTRVPNSQLKVYLPTRLLRSSYLFAALQSCSLNIVLNNDDC